MAMFNISGTVIADYIDTALDFGSASSVYFLINQAEAVNVSKQAEVRISAGTKDGAGNITARIVQKYQDPFDGLVTYAPVPQAVAAADTQSGDLDVTVNADNSVVTLSPGQIIADGYPTAIVTDDVFVLYTTQNVFGQLFLELKASGAATLLFGAHTFVEQRTQY